MDKISILLMISLCLGISLSETASVKRESNIKDLDSEASAKFFDLGNLLNRNPYQDQYYGGVGRPYGGGGYGNGGSYNNYRPYGNSYYPYNNNGYPNYGGSSGGFNPSYGSGYGTNILGGSGYPGVVGLGGYGGYGGNGGLQSYYGYFEPGYNGNRNIGYGYYPGTNRYGYFDRPSGYRGYN